MNNDLMKALTDLQSYAMPLVDKFQPALKGAQETELDPTGCSGCPLCTLARERGADDELVKRFATAGIALLRMFNQIPEDAAGKHTDTSANGSATP
ncbi:hypothetical protein [Antrihabitans sp. YC2-6]|uniref:hypothetical protein n=1 Tax=Antrihabitans sp. YC2-6 TaxID=2799498 RepID=UPI0018F65C2F|nr:hypothetical protein [Antrihabitans sp. YC2-6]MBJ8344048.1 hypothetical protein [Antrihabitans sp. YC2-6]